ncbi:AraC family transcriptional regulator [Paenibacillus sinopodophylli]|uniref:AraC family transcriptional regulator n=1 Tax=Paenibacillus sinopodophylli TaxID=1837342 RepID=UPI00148698E8|nr:AraC family transcriptional regulator [Paenibacillus sinopodophylli]
MDRKHQVFSSHIFLPNNLHMWVNRYTEDFMVPYHEHDFIEYCYVAEGSGFHHIEQETFPIHKGWLFIIPIGVAHVFRPSTSERSSKPPIVYNCLFDTHLATELSSLQEQPVQEHLFSLGNNTMSYFSVYDRDGSIEIIMQKLYREMSVRDTGSKTMLYTLLSQLIVTVYRRRYGDKNPLTHESADFNDVIYYLDQHFNQAITLSGLSRFAGWSERHLQRLFLKHTGQTFGSFLQNLRIQKSCELLRSSGLKINVIADAVGYRSIDSFNSAFKKTVGLTPTEYRKASFT